MPNPPLSSAADRSVPRAEALIWSGLVACGVGLFAHRLWSVLPLGRFGETLALAGLVAGLAWPLRRWWRRSWAEALALVWLGALVALTGALPAMAVLLLAATAIAIGGPLAGPARPLFALLAGFALIAGALGWLLPLPIHRAWVYLPLCLLAVALRRRALAESAAVIAAGWRDAIDAAPRSAAIATLALGVASAGAWPPTMLADDVAYHLGLPWQLMEHGAYALDPAHQVWALAPWAGDVLQGVAQVLAHAEARGALNVMWLLATAAGLWQLCAALGARPATRWVAIALYASLPLTQSLQGSMQTETPAAAATLGLALTVLAGRELGHRRNLWIGALLFALLAALKPMHALAALPLLGWALWRHRSDMAWRPLPVAVLLCVAVAGSSYAYAWIVAGNPVLPLFNGVFHSPYMAAIDFDDPRWHQGLGITLPWRITFDTGRYYEAWDGGFGFVMVALLGAWLLALALKPTRALAWVATTALLIPLLGLQYARYLHPAIVLLIPALLVAMQHAMPARRLAVAVIAVGALNFAYQANAQWMLHTGSIKRTLTSLGDRQRLFARYVPERALAAAMRERTPRHGLVLVLHSSAYAEFAGLGRTTAWYDPGLYRASARAETDPSGAAWVALWRQARITELLLHPDRLTPAQRAGLSAAGARRVLAIGDAQWWRMPEKTR